jgi:uncharacterized Zn-finger protein
VKKDNKCISCGGTGKTPDWLLKASEGSEKCLSCNGSGFDTSYKDQIVCPYCGKDNAPDDFYDSGEFQCGYCDKIFHVEINHSVDYSSTKVECLNDESLHQWKHETWYNEGKPRDGKYYCRCKGCNKLAWVELTPSDKDRV